MYHGLATTHHNPAMSCLSSCGLRFWGRKQASSPPNVAHEDDAEQPRPYTGSTAVGTSTGGDTSSEEKANQPEKRRRSQSVSQKLAVPVEAFTSALRERALSRSRSKSLVQPKAPSDRDEKRLPSLPPSDDKASPAEDKPEEPPRSSFGGESASAAGDGHEESPRSSTGDEKASPVQNRYSRPPRLELDFVTITGPAWPLTDDKRKSVLKQPDSAKKRVNSVDSLDTPTSPDFPDVEKKSAVERLSVTKRDLNRDSKLKDEGLDVETMEETEEAARKRKMRESRQRLAMQQPKEEQDRLDMFQCM